LGGYSMQLSKKEIKHTTAEGKWEFFLLFSIMKISSLRID